MRSLDTFSANSLKVLERDFEEFKNKYIYNLTLFKRDERALLGQKFHSLICAYLKNFDTQKMILELNEKENNIWLKLKEKLEDKKNNFIETEYSFLVKCALNNRADKPYYLTGRFDAIYKDIEGYVIYDWKTLNLPSNPYEDLQSVVYLYCASIIFNDTNIKMRYFSIEKLDFIDVEFKSQTFYKQRTDKVIEKLHLLNNLN